jgi:hypothetical protein
VIIKVLKEKGIKIFTVMETKVIDEYSFQRSLHTLMMESSIMFLIPR